MRISPASAGVRPNSVRASSVRPAPTRPASPTISPARTLKRDVPHARARGTPGCGSRVPRAAARAVRAPKTADISRPTMSEMSVDAVHPGRLPRVDPPAVAQHRDPVGELEDLVEAVRDVHDARAPCAHLAHSASRRATSCAGSAAVGSSMITMRASLPSARAISTSCCSAIESSLAGRSGSIARPGAREQRLRDPGGGPTSRRAASASPAPGRAPGSP